MDSKLEFKKIIKIIKKKLWIVIVITLLLLCISTVICNYLLNPVYESYTTLIVNKSNSEDKKNISTEELDVAERIAVTYSQIIKSRTVLNKVIDGLKLNYSYTQLSNNITVESLDDTQIIKITVLDNNPELAMKIANTIPSIFKEEIKRLTDTNKIKVLDTAITNNVPIKPNKSLIIVISTMVGFFMSIILIFLLEYLNTKIKSEEDVEKYLGIHVLGTVYRDSSIK